MIGDYRKFADVLCDAVREFQRTGKEQFIYCDDNWNIYYLDDPNNKDGQILEVHVINLDDLGLQIDASNRDILLAYSNNPWYGMDTEYIYIYYLDGVMFDDDESVILTPDWVLLDWADGYTYSTISQAIQAAHALEANPFDNLGDIPPVEHDWEAVVALMDDNIREHIHRYIDDGVSNAEFLAAYRRLHKAIYGQEFLIN